MANEKFKFNNLVIPDMDEDGYKVSYATTSTAASRRTQRGVMINKTLFTVEAYNLSWKNLKASVVGEMLLEVMNKDGFNFTHYNPFHNRWETSKFFAANFNVPITRIFDNDAKVSELSFQVTGTQPILTRE